MRHGKKDNHLGRTASHRSAMLSNMTASLILSKRIQTTLAKAKELRKYAEPLINRSKDDTTHSRRTVFSYLQSKEAVKELFSVVAEKVASRPGGYTRIIKLGNRLGDNADICLIELVDFNETLLNAAPEKKTRRGRRGGKKSDASVTVAPVVPVAETLPEAAPVAAADITPAEEIAPPTEPETPANGEEQKEKEA
ncbi:MAG: 50S ribosomal protein L17 [Cytophagaceae bacterium]|nr:50S ribosomal protein L17 [Cytophagaceae bacterium]